MAGKDKDAIIVRETDDRVIVQEGYSVRLALDAGEARFLARKLNRLALRIERRAAASAIEAPSGVETGNTDSTEGESAVPKADAQ